MRLAGCLPVEEGSIPFRGAEIVVTSLAGLAIWGTRLSYKEDQQGSIPWSRTAGCSSTAEPSADNRETGVRISAAGPDTAVMV